MSLCTRDCQHRISFAIAVLCTAITVAQNSLAQQPPLLSHAPQRPLPRPHQHELTQGPSYFVDSSHGSDDSPGSIDQPWRTLRHSVRQLRPGDTLYLRQGTYYEHVALTQSGTEGAPIVISAYPGELPILDGGLQQFLDDPAGSWEPSADGAELEFVSTRSFPEADARRTPNHFLPGSWEPMWGIEDQRPLALGNFADSLIPLHGYRTLDDLRSTNEYQPEDGKTGTLFCGPGLWFNRETQRIHIRLAHNQLPGLGERAYQGETDPRRLPLIIAVGFGQELIRCTGIRHVRLQGLVLRGGTGSPMISIYGSQGIELDHLTVYGGSPALLINASQQINVAHCAFRGLAAPWTGRAHMKYHGTASYQVVLQDDQPRNEDVSLSWCEFTDDHDFAYLRFVRNLDFHHNFVDNFNDDGLECGAKLRWHSFQIHHNHIGACLGVFQQHEIDKDESPETHDENSGLFVYRNVFDQRAGVYYQLPREPDPSGSFLHSEGHLISDHGSPIFPVMRVYQNTLLRREKVFRDYFLFGLGAVGMRNTERDVFNNLFVQTTATPGDVILGKEGFPLREGGNLLWGATAASDTAHPFTRLQKSPLFAASKQFYPAGWSTNDLVGDPRFHRFSQDHDQSSDLRLTAESPAVNAGIELPESWPDPLRSADAGPPDIGAFPLHSDTWAVGVDGRMSVFGDILDKSR